MSDKPTFNFTDTGLGDIMAKETAILLCKRQCCSAICRLPSHIAKRQHQNSLLICFLHCVLFYRVCMDAEKYYGNNWHLSSQYLPLRLISAEVNPMPCYNLSDSAPSLLGVLEGVRKACQCVSQFNSIKLRFKLQIKMQITSVIKASASTDRDKVHSSLLLPVLMKYKPRSNAKLNLILKNKVSQKHIVSKQVLYSLSCLKQKEKTLPSMYCAFPWDNFWTRLFLHCCLWSG